MRGFVSYPGYVVYSIVCSDRLTVYVIKCIARYLASYTHTAKSRIFSRVAAKTQLLSYIITNPFGILFVRTTSDYI